MAVTVAAALLVLDLSAGVASAAAPTVSNPVAGAVTGTTATLKGTVNPGGVNGTTWRFIWGTSNCAVKPSPCKNATGKVVLPLGSSPVPVEKAITGLTPGTVYDFILEAENGGVPVSSDNRVFATQGTPSEGLPDGRAYEQASPTNKNGEDAEGQFALTKAAIDGSGISFNATFGIPGGKDAQALPSYLALRGQGEAGWVTQGLLPPPIFGERAQVLGWLPDFSKTYSNAARLGNPRTKALVEQSTSGGEPQIVSPYTAGAEYSFAGAAPDGSVVLFESEAQLKTKEGGGALISAAVPGHPNVYAWDRATGEVGLAGVLNDGKAPAKGTIAGPYNWSGGTAANTLRLGGAKLGYYLQGTHAFSESGDVFFTEVGTGQLYQRINPTKPQSTMEGEKCLKPADACTIHVSASRRTTPGPDPAGPQPAAFAAASADGSVAYFTSPEKLTNESNTGPEQPKAAIGTGSAATKTIENEALVKAHAIGVDVAGSRLYWADPAGAIGRSDLNGENKDFSFIPIPPGKCELEVEVATEEFEVKEVEIPASPRYVTVDAAEKYVYWTNTGLLNKNSQAVDGGGTIGRAELDSSGNLVPGSVEPAFICGEVEPGLVSKERAISNPQGIAVNSEYIYWANAATENQLNRSLARAKIDGSVVKGHLFSPKSPNGFNSNEIPKGVALDSGHVYFGLDEPPEGSYIERVTLEGTEPNKFGGFGVGPAGVRGLAIDATYVYWANQGDGAIERAPIASVGEKGNCVAAGTCETVLEPKGNLNGLTINGSQLFWSVNGEAPTNPGNDLYRFERGASGETLEDLTFEPSGNGAEVQGVLGASADGSRVYFAANADLDGGGPASKGDCKTARPHGSISQTEGSCNVYLWDDGVISLVGRVKGRDKADEPTDATDWTGRSRDLFAGPKSAFVTKDGGTLLFASREKLTAYDNEGAPELYRFHVGDTALACVSCQPAGEAVGNGPSLSSIGFPGTISPLLEFAQMIESRNLSADGGHVFFETTEALVPGDTNGQGGCPGKSCQDVYEWEVPGAPGGTCTPSGPAYAPLNEGCLYLLSSGTSTFPSYFADASRDGSNVFFFTRQGLVGQDKDELQDVYDARVGGGIPSQNRVPVMPCESSDACHGPYSGAPAKSSPATPSFVGPQNPKHKRKKPAAKHKKHKTKKHKRQGNKRQKRASTERGTGR